MKRNYKLCHICGVISDKTAIALTKKLIDVKSTRFYCMFCLADYLDVTVDELLEKVEDFKLQGCTLFD
jgi:hypothetical protein